MTKMILGFTEDSNEEINKNSKKYILKIWNRRSDGGFWVDWNRTPEHGYSGGHETTVPA